MTRPIAFRILTAVMLLAGAAAATAQTSLTELGAVNAARNDMIGNSATAAASGAQPPETAPAATPPPAGAPAATKSVGFGGMKYTLSYALMLMLIGLGTFLVCRPSHRHEPE